jgi:DNA primase
MALSDLKDIIKETPLSQIIGGYIPLKIKGNVIEGICPFHPDHHPSLKVNDQKKLFMCFACQTGGDAITFVQKFRGIGFIDALKEIAGLLSLDFKSFEEEKKVSPKIEMAKKLLSRAVKIFIKSSHPAFENFLKNRNLDRDTVEKFQIGFAPGNNVLYHYLQTIKDPKEKDFAIEVAVEIGLLKKEPNFYDTFRDRVMFPIWDRNGNVVGFTSRALFDYQKAKYMNSPASLIFDKKNILYGLHHAVSSIREKNAVILCEGNMDLVALHKSHFENSIAIMGLGLSEKSILILKDLAKNFYLALDSDDAGRSATERVNRDLLSHGIVAKFLDFTPQKDPDEYLAAQGPIKFAALLENAPTYLDLTLNKLIPEKIPQNPDKKLQILNNVFEKLSPLGTNLLALERLAQIILKIGLKSGIEPIQKAYEDYLRLHPQGQMSSQTIEIPKKKTYPTPTPQKNPEVLSRGEKHLTLEIIHNPEYLMHDEINVLLDLIPHSEVKPVVLRLKNLYMEVDEISFYSHAKDLFNGEDISLGLKEAAGLAFFRPRLIELDSAKREKVRERVFRDLMGILKEDRLLKEKEDSKEKLKECSALDEMKNLMTKIFEIEKELDRLKLQR